MADVTNKKTAAELLRELNRVRAILQARAAGDQSEDIPLLEDVVGAIPTMDGPATKAAAPPAVPPETRAPAAPQPPAAALEPPAEQELQALIDRIIDQEMPRIRLELKRALRDELRMRGLLK